MRIYITCFVTLCLIICIQEFSYTQTFERYYSTNLDDNSPDAIEFENGGYMVVINRGNYFSPIDDFILLKLDSSGIIIDSLIYEISNEYQYWGVNNLFNLSDSVFICTQVCEDNLQNLYLNFIKFDIQLNVILDTVVGYTFPELYLLYYDLTEDNKIVVAASETINNVFFLYEFDLYKDSLSYHPIIDTGGIINHTPMVVHSIPGKFKYHVYMNDFYKSIYEINRTDYSIDTTYYNTPQHIIPRDAINGFNDSTYLVAGQYFFGDQDNISPTLSTLSNDGNIINYTNYIFQNDTNIYSSQKCISANTVRLFYAVTYNYIPQYPFYIYPQQRWIWLICLYPNGSIDWQYFYKGELNYMPSKVLATNDGGALIISGKYDWNDPIPYQRDVHILKVDSTGWYQGMPVGLTEFEKPKQILVYPNPVKDQVNFVLGYYKDLNLEIYNSNGTKVLTGNIEHSMTFDLAHLTKGLYVYILSGKDGFVEKGKLVKQ